MPFPIGAAIGGVVDAAEFIKSISDEKEAKKELSHLKTPFYKVQDQYYQNDNIAKSLAGQGATSTERQYFTDESEKGLQSGLSGLLQISNDPNQVSKLLDSFTKSVGSFAAKSSEQQVANIQNFMTTNKDLAGQLTTQWGINEFQPYENKLKELTERRGAAQQNEFNSASAFAGTVGAAQTAMSNDDLIKKLFPGGGFKPGGSQGAEDQDTPFARRDNIDFTLQPTH